MVREAQPSWNRADLATAAEEDVSAETSERSEPGVPADHAGNQGAAAEDSAARDSAARDCAARDCAAEDRAAEDRAAEDRAANDRTPEAHATDVRHLDTSSAAGTRASESSDPDALQELGDEIAVLAAHIHAATHRLLVLIARFDRLEGWKPVGFRSCAHWLAHRTGIGLGAAREKVRAARALEGLPETSASMARGELSFSKVRALTRVATPESEGELLELARSTTAAELERVVRAWRTLGRTEEARAERRRHRLRRFAVFPDDDGMYVVRGRLDPEVGALLMRAVEAASDALYRAGRRPSSPTDDGPKEQRPSFDPGSGGPPARRRSFDPAGEVTPEQRRADAVGLLCERAMAAGFGGEDGELDVDASAGGLRGRDAVAEGDPSEHPRDPESVSAETCGELEGEVGSGGERKGEGEGRSRTPVRGTRAERYQVFLHVDHDTLDPAAEPGRSNLEDGTRVSAETSRRLSCDAAVVRIEHGRRGSGPKGSGRGVAVLDVGRRTRTVPPAIRRALEIRDRGCRFPGCGLRFADAHHVRHWADGGRTRLDNLVLLCRFHHRLVHEEGWRVVMGEGGSVPLFIDPRGGMHAEAPPRICLDERPERPERPDSPDRGSGHARVMNPIGPEEGTTPLARLLRDNRTQGANPDYRTATARFKRDSDVPVELVRRALDALDPLK